MRNLLSPSALLAVLILTFACTPKVADQTAATPSKPVPTAEWDTLGKPLVGPDGDDPAYHEYADEDEPEDYYMMDEALVMPEDDRTDTLPRYNPSHTFEHDLVHTKLELSFDWEKKRVNGKATLTVRPWFYATDKLTLDAKNFDIHYVGFEGKKDTLRYDYDNEELVVHLGKTYTRTEEYKVVVHYTAKPDERESYGGSAAISMDKGLYFINPDGSDPDKPRQIWTQGETESNSFWFPTTDKPNQRCTQEMYLTVEDKYKTLSNGLLLSSKKNPDGTRTDYWKMDKPHAPYLFMITVGEFAVVKDKWRNIPLEYYVEPKYEAYARDIFPYTPEMLEFFSKKLGYDYPWQKYSQVVVRDYVSGAMENTTAVIFGEFMQQDKRGLLDNHLTNEKIVAHEMFHHWFGDLVTTESWANLTLNEGFANYSEYLWLEHKHGRDEADYHEMVERQGYVYSALDGGRPLIHFGYENRESMFDAHSYNKGGAILHMLRTHVGDDAFFAALQYYLKKHAHTDVEVHELRMAFEDVIGQDFNWFFNQWFLGSGHPNLDISYDWDAAEGKSIVTIAQTQEPNKQTPYIYDLPMQVDLYDASGKARRESIRLTKRTQTFSFDAPERPAVVNVDAEKALLAVKNDQHTLEEWAFLYRHGRVWQDRWEAVQNLKKKSSKLAKEIMAEALRDKHWSIRQEALSVADLKNPDVAAAVVQLAKADTKPSVRATAIRMLGQTEGAEYVPVFEKGMGLDQPYSVLGASLEALSKANPEAAITAAKNLENDDNEGVVLALAELYANNPEPAASAWFAKRAKKVDNMAAFRYYELYVGFLTDLNDPALLGEAAQSFQAVALDGKASLWRRFANTRAISELRNFYREAANKAKADELTKMLADIREKEADPTLKLYYGMFE